MQCDPMLKQSLFFFTTSVCFTVLYLFKMYSFHKFIQSWHDWPREIMKSDLYMQPVRINLKKFDQTRKEIFSMEEYNECKWRGKKTLQNQKVVSVAICPAQHIHLLKLFIKRVRERGNEREEIREVKSHQPSVQDGPVGKDGVGGVLGLEHNPAEMNE